MEASESVRKDWDEEAPKVAREKTSTGNDEKKEENAQYYTIRKYNGNLLDLDADGVGNTGAMLQHIKAFVKRKEGSGAENKEQDECMYKGVYEIFVNKLIGSTLASAPAAFTPRMALENFAVGPIMANGRFGKVYPAYYGSEEKVALKVLDTVAYHPENVYKERDIMLLLDHKNICKLLGAFYKGCSFLVLEFCIGNAVSMSLNAEPKHIVAWTVHLLRALEYVHARDIIHCDVSPENCLIGYDGRLKLSDFGSAQQLPTGVSEVKSGFALGQPQYQDDVANELFIYSKRSDMFSAACCIFYMTTLRQLLGYKRTSKVEDYVLAYRLGKLKRATSKRQPLVVRIKKSELGGLLYPMIVENKYRVITAQLALLHCNLREIMQKYDITQRFVNKGERRRDTYLVYSQEKFPHFATDEFAEGIDMYQAMSGLYYDSGSFQGPARKAWRRRMGTTNVWAEVYSPTNEEASAFTTSTAAAAATTTTTTTPNNSNIIKDGECTFTSAPTPSTSAVGAKAVQNFGNILRKSLQGILMQEIPGLFSSPQLPTTTADIVGDPVATSTPISIVGASSSSTTGDDSLISVSSSPPSPTNSSKDKPKTNVCKQGVGGKRKLSYHIEIEPAASGAKRKLVQCKLELVANEGLGVIPPAKDSKRKEKQKKNLVNYAVSDTSTLSPVDFKHKSKKRYKSSKGFEKDHHHNKQKSTKHLKKSGEETVKGVGA